MEEGIKKQSKLYAKSMPEKGMQKVWESMPKWISKTVNETNKGKQNFAILIPNVVFFFLTFWVNKKVVIFSSFANLSNNI